MCVCTILLSRFRLLYKYKDNFIKTEVSGGLSKSLWGPQESSVKILTNEWDVSLFIL